MESGDTPRRKISPSVTSSSSASSRSRSGKGDTAAIEPGLEHINQTGGVVAGALPLLYGFAEGIVTGATYEPDPEPENPPNLPAMGSRRSRLFEGVGYHPE